MNGQSHTTTRDAPDATRDRIVWSVGHVTPTPIDESRDESAARDATDSR